ncbi:hypothetical protein SAY87_013950 [Trapa incisa]|uniref:Plastocyanin-like domain-containing protein n=1 Tax=Trapa incisa TaxID=236973 RepID=A0AAN7KJN5_9MYRT|nr:hypothetical protein SAY87_013950 [Trapa incisa]
MNPMDVLKLATFSGAAPNVSDAFTMNGQPGDLYRCSNKGPFSNPILPSLPAFNDTATATAFTAKFRSPSHAKVPLEVDENLFFTVGLGLINCSRPSPRCQGPNGTRFTASMNNVSFVLPRANSLMQAYYQNLPGVFTTDFPPVPPIKFDYTGNVGRGLWQPTRGTKLDTAKFNLIDPPIRNTIGTSPGGWVAIRFVADNPGVWLMHCHIDAHFGTGLAMAFLVENGVGELQSVQPPPSDLPRC